MKAKAFVIAFVFTFALHTANAATLEEQFRNPPPWTKPWCYWFWIDGDVTEDGITKDLAPMAELGIQRAIIMNVHHEKSGTGPVKTLSAKWRALNRYALREAARLGIEFAMFNCPGWSQSGGPWNKPEHSMRRVTWKETPAKGGAFSALVRPSHKLGVQDIAVLAVPRTDAVTIARPCRGKMIEFSHKQPFTVRSLSLIPNKDNYTFEAKLLAVAADGRRVPVAQISESVKGRNAYTSFSPFGPETFSFKEARAATFVLEIGKADGVATVEVSSAPKVAQVIEKQLGRMHPTPTPSWDTYRFPATVEPDDSATVIEPKSIINLTEHLDEDGVLHCRLPLDDQALTLCENPVERSSRRLFSRICLARRTRVRRPAEVASVPSFRPQPAGAA